MKKLLVCILAAVLALAATTTALAAGRGAESGRLAVCTRCPQGAALSVPRLNRTDTDGDGVCDNYTGTRCAVCGNYADVNGDGVCGNCTGTHCAACGNYTDVNGDGVCNNCTGTQCVSQESGHYGGGHHGGGHC